MAQTFPQLPAVPDHPALERDVLAWWDKQGIFDRLREQNRDGEIWHFLDGPITANNPMGVHHAWGRTLKDVFVRYKALRGFRQRYKNGFDCARRWWCGRRRHGRCPRTSPPPSGPTSSTGCATGSGASRARRRSTTTSPGARSSLASSTTAPSTTCRRSRVSSTG